MKKIVTLLSFLPVFAFAQGPSGTDGSYKALPAKGSQVISETNFPNPAPVRRTSPSARKSNGGLYAPITIGTTGYDLQSNAAVARRLIVLPGNKISATWTTAATEQTPWPTRGSGYNHFDGTSWGTVSSDKIEGSDRTGWPSIGVMNDGGTDVEYIIAHAVTSQGFAGGFIMSKNAAVGNRTFTGTKILVDSLDLNQYPGPIWNRSASTTNRIILVSAFTDSNSTQPTNYRLEGVRNPVTYSVYDKAQGKWILQNKLLPGYDSTRYPRGNGDEYDIFARGSEVAIVIGGYGSDLAVWRSSNEGDTWTKTVIDTYPNPAGVFRTRTNPLLANNGEVNVVIDKDNDLHIFYPILVGLWDSIGTDTSTRVFTGLDGILHWTDKKNGNNEYDKPNVVGGMMDIDQDGSLTIAQNARSRTYGGYSQAAGLVDGNGNQFTLASISNFPSAAADNNGFIYAVYSTLMENDESPDGENYRDIYITFSSDKGKTWAAPQNITQTTGVEEIFPTLATTVDGFVHLMYEEKEDPGIFVSGTNNTASMCSIKYVKMPVSDITGFRVGVSRVKEASFAVSQFYPNPTNGITNFDLNLQRAGQGALMVTNMLGEQVMTRNYGMLGAGAQTLTLDVSTLSKGMYICSFRIGQEVITRPMMVIE